MFVILWSLILILPSDVVVSSAHQQPENDIELSSTTHGIHHHHDQIIESNQHEDQYKNKFLIKNYKPFALNRKGKHHHRSLKSKARKFLDPKTVYFDYYPVEHVKLNYDSHEDDNIKVTLISEQDDLEKKQNHNHHQRQKRDTKVSNDIAKTIPTQLLSNDAGSDAASHGADDVKTNIQKREGGSYNYFRPNPQFYERDYYTQRIPFITAEKFIKHPIRGNYYNPFVPSANGIPFQFLTNNGQNNNNNNNNNDGQINFGTRIDQTEGIDERLIWGRRPINGNDNNKIDNNQVPTRPGHRRPTQSPAKTNTSPPLIHVANPNERLPSNSQTTQASRNDFIENNNNNQQSDIEKYGGPVWRPLPPNQREPIATTSRPSFVQQTPLITEQYRPPVEQGPSKCVWAIVTCCSRHNPKVRYSCFEEIGCHGAFWDINPCADEYQRRAIAEADSYFE